MFDMIVHDTAANEGWDLAADEGWDPAADKGWDPAIPFFGKTCSEW